MTDHPINAVVVDDEQLARRYLKDLLKTHPNIKVVAECTNGFEAVKAITELEPDLVFLDIQMPKLSGFEVLELLDKPINVIFVTAYDQYAVQAFDACAIDYLLKPFSPERLKEALDKVYSMSGTKDDRIETLKTKAREASGYIKRIVVRDGTRVVIIHDAQIDFIQAEGDYVSIHAGGESYLKLQTIKSLEENLSPDRFVRIHRSCILNVERLAGIELMSKDKYVAIIEGGFELPISRSGHKRLKQVIGN